MITTLILSFFLAAAGQFQVPPDDDPLRLNDEMKHFLDVNIAHSSDSLHQLQQLVQLVFQKNVLGFTYVQETRTAIETFEKRGGNCISFTFLLIAMARHLEMDARYQEIEIAPMWSRVGDFVSVNGHANVAVIIGGQKYVVDLFPQVNRIEIGGSIVSDNRAVAHFLNNRGVDRLSDDESQLAMAYFRKALEKDATADFAWVGMGVAQALNQELYEAEKSYKKALQLNRGNLIAMSDLAFLYRRMGRERDAERYQAKVRAFQLKNPYYHFDLGLQAYRSGSYREALEFFKNALKLKPSEHSFHLALARAYSQLGELEKAANSLKMAMKYAPDESSKLRYNEKLALLATRRHSS